MKLTKILVCALLLGSSSGHAQLVATGTILDDDDGGEELLSWDESSGATGYKVYWSDVDFPGPPYSDSEDVGNVLSASPTGYELGMPARIRAYDATGLEGQWSDEINVPACDSSVTTASNLATAVSGAVNNSVLCLGDGAYGQEDLFNMSRSGPVALRCTNGPEACTISPRIGNSDYIQVMGVTLGSLLINSCSLQTKIVGNIASASGINVDGSGCVGTPQNYYFALNQLIDTSQSVAEGRIVFNGANTFVFETNTVRGIGTEGSDGLQITGDSVNGIVRVNEFEDINDAELCNGAGDPHCDSIQLFGAGPGHVIEGNWFHGTSAVHIMSPDGCEEVTVRNNVFDGSGSGDINKLQFGSCIMLAFDHNTLYNAGTSFDAKTGGPPATESIARSNVWIASGGGHYTYKTSGGNGCDGCEFLYNQGISNTAQTGCSGCTLNNNSATTPTFIGGSVPTTVAGWALEAGSAGEDNGHDSEDRGSLFTNPAAPANFEESP